MNNIKYLGLLGIPLATLGIVGSVAFAQTNALQTTATPPPSVQQAAPEVADQNEAQEQADSTESNTQEDQADDANEGPETNDGPDGGPSDGDN